MMFREKSISKFYAYALAAVFALTLAGCGGSGGGTAATPDPDPTPIVPVVPDPRIGIAQMAAAAAATAAATASDAAEAAVTGVYESMAADAASFARAQDAAAEAAAASEAAAAASATAAAADTSDDAEAAQADAEAAQADAEAAQMAVAGFAAMVTESNRIAVAISGAQSATMTAADAAEAASDAAAQAVADVEDDKDSDLASHTRAVDAAAEALAASSAAAAAVTAANGATTEADAQAAQKIAETAQTNAEKAQTSAEGFAGMVTTAKDDAQALSVAQAAAMTAAVAARTAANEADDAAGEAAALAGDAEHESAVAARAAAALAETAAVAAEAANDTAQAATASADAMAAQADAEEAQGTAEAQLVLANDAKAATQLVADARNEETENTNAAASVVAATKAAATKATAIKKESEQVATADAGLGGSADFALVDGPTLELEVSRPRSGTTLKFTDSDEAGDDNKKFTLFANLGGGITRHDRTQEADDDGDVVNEIVMVRTDIQVPKATLFAKVADQALNADKDGVMEDDKDDAVAFDPGDALDGETPADALVLAKIMGFTAADGTTVMHSFTREIEDDDTTADVDESKDAAEVDGTFNGAKGTYKCTGDTDCTVTVNGKGVATAASNGWIFTPVKGATSDVADADFMDYGFWLKTTTDEDGVLTYNEVETYARSSIVASDDVSAVTGSATYEGDALGVYVKNVLTPEGTIDTATSGHFTADVNLKAYFGQTVDDLATTPDEAGTIPPGDLFTLSGTINKFELAGGEANNWSVKLQGDIGGDGTAAPTGVPATVTRATGKANGGGDPGTYSATFHGVTGADNDQPSSVVGEFDANFSNGSVAGAFGAREKN